MSWKNANRDAFSAFMCDETALDILRSVVVDMGWAPEKCHRGGLRNAIQSLSITNFSTLWSPLPACEPVLGKPMEISASSSFTTTAPLVPCTV